MVRHSLTALLVALCPFAEPPASAHTSAADEVTLPRNVDEVLCAGEGLVGADIAVGPPGPERIELSLESGDTCGKGYTSPSGLSAFTTIDASHIEVRDRCLAFRRQAAKLRPSAERQVRLQGDGQMPSVQVGLFSLTNWAGYFELETPKGRNAAEQWVRQTLAAVRPCWDLSNDDDAPRLVDRLYADLALKPG
jgi:hypothetical protein